LLFALINKKPKRNVDFNVSESGGIVIAESEALKIKAKLDEHFCFRYSGGYPGEKFNSRHYLGFEPIPISLSSFSLVTEIPLPPKTPSSKPSCRDRCVIL